MYLAAPEVPTVYQAYSKQSESIRVEFGEVSGASSYILRAQTLDGEFFSETEVSSSPSTVSNLQPYTTYSLSVLSVNAGGRSQPSLPVVTRTGISKFYAGWHPASKCSNTTLNILLSPALFEHTCPDNFKFPFFTSGLPEITIHGGKYESFYFV